MPRVPLLIVESRVSDGRRLADELAHDGYRVDLARSAEHARILARAGSPELLVLGFLDEPGGALGLLAEVRESGGWPTAPAVLVLRCGDPLQTLRAFEAGADDCVPSGTGYLELRARLRAIRRRALAAANSRAVLEVQGLRVDTARHEVVLGERPLRLRRLEFALLVQLAREPRRVHPRAELLAEVWGYRSPGSTRTLESHASRLRRKLAAAGAGGWVVNVRGVGYRLL
jgi:DNA-binding response OmpR family regulator